MTVLYGFFDDSGTHTGSPFLVYAGLVGTDQQWSRLRLNWGKLLARPMQNRPALQNFHLSECVAGRGAFLDYSSAEREHLRYQFRQIIIGSELRALGYAVAVADWDELIQGEARDWFGSAEDIAFGGCIRGAMEATHIMSEEVLALHFDAGRKGSVLALANRALKRHSGPVLLQSIQFSQVGQETALQAADMLAWETFQFAKDHRLGNQANPHFQNLLENIVAQGFMLDRKSILATLEDFRLNVAIEG